MIENEYIGKNTEINESKIQVNYNLSCEEMFMKTQHVMETFIMTFLKKNC